MANLTPQQLRRNELLIQSWMTKLELAGKATNTRRLYRREIEHLALLGPLDQLTLDDLNVHLRKRGGEARTVNNRIVSIQSFYRYLLDSREIDDDPSARLERRDQEPLFPRPIENTDAAFAKLDHESRAMAVFLLETGLETTEVKSVKVTPRAPERITVTGRAGRSRDVFLTPEARQALDDLGGEIKIGARALQRRFEKGNFTARQLRHTLATQLAASGVDVLTIQKILGHKNPQATKKYVGLPLPDADVAAHAKRRQYLLRKRSGMEGAREIEDEIIRFLDSDVVAAEFGRAISRWREAQQRLRTAETTGELTEIGHVCREAMQLFASALANRHGIKELSPDPAKTVEKLRAVLAKFGLGEATKNLLTALLAYWGAASDLVQRQEHGAGKEGEPLAWEDARRVVFQTLIVMFEIARATR